jgi:two-component system, chemotaxis family, chemotaxis protein CheY
MPKKVVIVDDSESVAAALAMALEAALGVRTLVALHPQTALKLFQSESEIAALVTDLSLPGLDGFQLIGTLRRLPAYQRLPAVMITAEEDAGMLDTPVECRPNVILHKPFSLKEVCSVVQSLLA